MKRRAKLNKMLHSQAGIFLAVLAFKNGSCHQLNGVGFFVFWHIDLQY